MPTVDHLADELARFADALRRAGQTGMRRQLTAGMKRAAGPVPKAIRDGLKPHLPDRYAEVLDADLRIEIVVRTGQADPAVSVIASPVAKQRKLRQLDAGILKHPVFGDRKRRWPTQQVEPGWFTGPARRVAPRAREEIAAALDQMQADIWAETHG